MKFEREVEQKAINSDKLNYLNSTDWKKTLYIIQNKSFISFIDNLVEFYSPIEDTDKERIFLAKH